MSAARALSSYVAWAAVASMPGNANNTNSTALATALRTAALHAIAYTYRSELPVLSGYGNATVSQRTPATVIVNPSWIFGAAGYVAALIIVAWLLRWYTVLALGGVHRTGSALSGAALLTSPSPFAELVQEGGNVDSEELDRRAVKQIGTRRLLIREIEGGQWRITYAQEQDQEVESKETQETPIADNQAPLTGRDDWRSTMMRDIGSSSSLIASEAEAEIRDRVQRFRSEMHGAESLVLEDIDLHDTPGGRH